MARHEPYTRTFSQYHHIPVRVLLSSIRPTAPRIARSSSAPSAPTTYLSRSHLHPYFSHTYPSCSPLSRSLFIIRVLLFGASYCLPSLTRSPRFVLASFARASYRSFILPTARPHFFSVSLSLARRLRWDYSLAYSPRWSYARGLLRLYALRSSAPSLPFALVLNMARSKRISVDETRSKNHRIVQYRWVSS